MNKIVLSFLLLPLITACSHNKNLAQTTSMQPDEALIKNINSSTSDTEVIDPVIKRLQKQNDLVISFATLNYAWSRKGSYYVLVMKNKTWEIYSYDAKLPPAKEEAALLPIPKFVSADAAQKIKSLYAKAELWKTEGDNGESFCDSKKDCNITDEETWTISVATPQNIHTTAYYAPEFFEQCCPGNAYRKAFVSLAKEMMKLVPEESSAPEK